MNSSATVKWIVLALLGLAVAVAVAISASNLLSRQIGIASESVSAGDTLAPAVESAARRGADEDTGRDAPKAGTPPAASGEPDVGTAPAVGNAGSDRTPESADEFEDRLDAEEDAREDREDALEDALDDREDAREDNSGRGSDD